MSKQIIHTDAAPKAIGIYSQAVRAGDTVYVSGQIPLDPRPASWSRATSRPRSAARSTTSRRSRRPPAARSPTRSR
jgi:enamine deaminase RidA (YjgF/YER057c/UK114 family)